MPARIGPMLGASFLSHPLAVAQALRLSVPRVIWESGSKSLREIGELFSGLHYAAVAQRIRRTRLAHDAQTNRKLLKEMLNVKDLTPISSPMTVPPNQAMNPTAPWRGNVRKLVTDPARSLSPTGFRGC
jgi:hypothetical protein